MTSIIFIDLNGRHFLPHQLLFLSGEPPELTIRRAVLGYRTAGLSARDLADDIPADAETGEGGLLPYAAFAKVSEDFIDIEIDLAFAVASQENRA